MRMGCGPLGPHRAPPFPGGVTSFLRGPPGGSGCQEALCALGLAASPPASGALGERKSGPWMERAVGAMGK